MLIIIRFTVPIGAVDTHRPKPKGALGNVVHALPGSSGRNFLGD